jgi:4-amino-4-deoxy-L-arabinose transferase-like glycosyltransferase
MRVAEGLEHRRAPAVRLIPALAALLGVAATAVRCAWALAVTPPPVSDAASYWKHALRLAAHGLYGLGGLPTAYRPVGYPAALASLIALFGEHESVFRGLNVGAAAVTLAALFALARRITGSDWSALLALALYGAYPADVAYTSLALSEPLFNALSLAALALLLGGRRSRVRAACAGVLLGLATLTRPQGLLLLPIALTALACSQLGARRLIGQACLITAALSLTLAPWTARNARVFHAFVPVSTNGGVNLLIGNNPAANGCYHVPKLVDSELSAARAGARDRVERELAADRGASRLAFAYMRAHPREALALWRPKLRCLFHSAAGYAFFTRELPAEQQRWFKRLHRADDPYYRVLLWGGTLGALIAAAQSLGSRAARQRLLWLPGACGIACVGVALLTFGDPRFHHPIMPWLALYAAYAASWPFSLRAARGVARNLLSLRC